MMYIAAPVRRSQSRSAETISDGRIARFLRNPLVFGEHRTAQSQPTLPGHPQAAHRSLEHLTPSFLLQVSRGPRTRDGEPSFNA